MLDPAITDGLACPRCDSSLVREESGFKCTGCKTEYPDLGGVPFLFAEPGVALDEWRQRYHARLRDIEQELAGYDRALAAGDVLAATLSRLTAQRQALLEHAEELKALLQPLDVTHLEADHTTYLALRTRVPSDQGLSTYYGNLHRDWCWGDEENAVSAELVSAALAGHDAHRLLVLGAGGGRLAYDLHASIPKANTVALDLSPMLLLAASRVMQGDEVPLTEFPIAPRTAETIAVKRVLKAPAAARAGLSLVLANALRAPFKPGTFDTLVTPWLVDVIDEPLATQAARWNQLLDDGGRWVWFGSHAFRHADPAQCVSLEESIAIIEAHGFSTPEVTEAEIPYMVSPASRHGRRERVVVMTMTKTGKVKAPKRHVALPDWLVRNDQPVPSAEYFQVQAMQTRVHAFFMALVDGKRSIADMAAVMEAQRLMPRDEAEATIRNFLIRMYEDSQGYSTF